MPVGTIESLDHAGQGIARDGGKTIFVEGALPGELVSWLSYRRKPSFEQARVTEVHRAASTRVEPRCPHFGVCGGCSLQHADPSLQIATKQRVLEDNLRHIGRQRHLHVNLCARHGMAEVEPCGVQGLPLDAREAAAVEVVAEQRVSEMREVDADLVRAARVEHEVYER